MMMIIILVTVLFLVGFINTYFNLPPTKILPYIQSFVPNSSSIISIKTKTDPKENNKKKRKKSSDQENSQLKRVFTTFDKNGDGFITKQELGESLKNIGFLYTDKEVSNMVERLDVNGDGLIDIDEFCEIYESMGKGDDEVGGEDDEGGKEEELREAFDVFDGDGDGLITVEELGSVLLSLGLKQGLSVVDCKEMIRKVDMDGDGMVSFDEFKIMMKDGGKLVDIS